MDIFMKRKSEVSVIDLVRRREIQESARCKVNRKLKVTSNFVKRLGLEKVLKGHAGCVNCLEWNESGSILASASDDVHVILWDPFTHEGKLKLHTLHDANIFTVKFMPKSNDSILVTGAGDRKIHVNDIVADTLLVCSCHFGRVKRIATAPSEPFLFWSAAEDGYIIQHDLRLPHTCRCSSQQNVLVNLMSHVHGVIDPKCISVNPRRPELVAVGASDSYVRMYDRRMIKLTNLVYPTQFLYSIINSPLKPDSNVPVGCVQYFIAGHLKLLDNCKSTTYLTFSDDGNELLVNMGAEQIYLFDINNNANSRNFVVPVEIENNEDQDCSEPCVDSSNSPIVLKDLSALNVTKLEPEVEELRIKANEAFGEKRYVNAIALYNEAISKCPYSAVLYGNRAGTYLERSWVGDCYAALRDCRITLALDPGHVKAHYRLARCLFALNQIKEAEMVMKNFEEKFPSYIKNTSCKMLKKEIREALETAAQTPNLMKADRLSPNEKVWRENAIDFETRLCGHCNMITDIKEANYFGEDGKFIVAGSDDGSLFVWDRYTTNIVRVLNGDKRIVNCVQPHPSICLLATSGIDPYVKLWSPLPEDGTANVDEITHTSEAAILNYLRMNTDNFEEMFYNIGYTYPE